MLFHKFFLSRARFPLRIRGWKFGLDGFLPVVEGGFQLTYNMGLFPRDVVDFCNVLPKIVEFDVVVLKKFD